MHPYLPHLLQDIEAAKRAEFDENEPQSLIEHFIEIDRWVEGVQDEIPFCKYCGLNPELFPPHEQLSTEDISCIRKAYEEMLDTWNIAADIPDEVPPHMAYNLLVDILNANTAILRGGYIHFDFCHGNPGDCVLKEYCSCLKFKDYPIDF